MTHRAPNFSFSELGKVHTKSKESITSVSVNYWHLELRIQKVSDMIPQVRTAD